MNEREESQKKARGLLRAVEVLDREGFTVIGADVQVVNAPHYTELIIRCAYLDPDGFSAAPVSK
jgi:hypothetical protein